MIRKDPEMRYTSEQCMNDSWVISGPLITGISYYSNSNSNSKILLKKNLISRNGVDKLGNRPKTTSNVLLDSSPNKIVSYSKTKIQPNTQYGSFANNLRKSLQNDQTSGIQDSLTVSAKNQQSVFQKNKEFTMTFHDVPVSFVSKSYMNSKTVDKLPEVLGGSINEIEDSY